MRTTHLLALVLALAAAGAATSAAAATQVREDAAMASANCQAALPAYEGLIRKRPLGVFNEGSSSAFVTCGFPGKRDRVVYSFYISAENTTNARVDIDCTLVHRWGLPGSPAQYLPKRIHLIPNGSGGPTWRSVFENDNIPFAMASVSCNLPPGTGLNYLENWYLEDIGN
ncbi:hypothetical protein [Luteimonas sp. MC1828]|uniref:hypothetical protein n=1 Tax=Luteimonas sp. MC1828 TaxID=2799787 RepID=UPI0018F1EA5E|nr:hypothetical protein [Luteimonas sp. MC1828]MBJ7576000.1 hypothetical protein [Luteimonas sp. MC1828]